jgi:SAM-dependent methyltransferase
MGLYRDHLRPRLHMMALNDRLTGEIRGRVCAGLAGEVLEIGYGSGLNLPHLPRSVTGVWAVEPSATGVRLGEARRAASPVPVVVAGTDARSLPFPDDRFDAALCTWVLCGIPDPGAALAEVARVLKPGGALHFIEHGLAPDPGVVRWQRRGNRINHALSGCVLDTDVRTVLAASPLTVTALTE